MIYLFGNGKIGSFPLHCFLHHVDDIGDVFLDEFVFVVQFEGDSVASFRDEIFIEDELLFEFVDFFHFVEHVVEELGFGLDGADFGVDVIFDAFWEVDGRDEHLMFDLL